MTTQQMEYFHSVASLLSFNKAARVHYTSPSVITRQIASLEAELGVKLLKRNTHRVTVTSEGKLFFLSALSIMGELNRYRESLISIGKLPQDETPLLRVCCYTSDSMYRLLVDRIQKFPADWLSKPCKFIFPAEGQMVSFVQNGLADLGVDSVEYLNKYNDEFGSKLLHRSPFRLLVGRKHPLAHRRMIGIDELLSRYNTYGDYISLLVDSIPVRSHPIRNAEELRKLGEFTISQLPHIIPRLGYSPEGKENPKMDDLMLLVPRELELFDFSRLHAIQLRDDPIATDYALFWKKENDDPDIIRFLQLAGV